MCRANNNLLGAKEEKDADEHAVEIEKRVQQYFGFRSPEVNAKLKEAEKRAGIFKINDAKHRYMT